MRHQIGSLTLFALSCLLGNACSSNGGASDEDSGASGNGIACDTSTLPLPADCGGWYECDDKNPPPETLGYWSGVLVHTATGCVFQAATAALNPPFEVDLSDSNVRIDGRLFFTRGSTYGEMTCFPSDGPQRVQN